MIPDWFDLVVWGHEHKQEVKPRESAVGTFRVMQPGSSVATSLVEGEAEHKSIGLLTVKDTHFRVEATQLTQVRPFLVDELVLAEIDDLDPMHPDVEKHVNEILAQKVNEMIEAARADAAPSSLPDEFNKTGLNGKKASKIAKREQVLVRLRVDHTGFQSLNAQRFGAQFVGQVRRPVAARVPPPPPSLRRCIRGALLRGLGGA